LKISRLISIASLFIYTTIFGAEGPACGTSGAVKERIADCQKAYPTTAHRKGNLRDSLTDPPSYYYWTLITRLIAEKDRDIQLWQQDETNVLWTNLYPEQWTWNSSVKLSKIFADALGIQDPDVGTLILSIPRRKDFEIAFVAGLDKAVPSMEDLEIWTSTSHMEVRSEWVYGFPTGRIDDPPGWYQDEYQVERCTYLKPGKSFGEFDYSSTSKLYTQFVGRWNPLPPDFDRDGVADVNDYCPHTPKGLKVWTFEDYSKGRAQLKWVGCAGGQLGDTWDGSYAPPQSILHP
jgi:hypothetical protein